MSSSNVHAAFIARVNDRVQDDNLSMLHKPRTVYVVIPAQQFLACMYQ